VRLFVVSLHLFVVSLHRPVVDFLVTVPRYFRDVLQASDHVASNFGYLLCNQNFHRHHLHCQILLYWGIVVDDDVYDHDNLGGVQPYIFRALYSYIVQFITIVIAKLLWLI